jgi:large subunit ribosomal protein L22e
MVVKGLKKKSTSQQKKIHLRFVVDCAQPVADKVIDAAGLEQYLRDRIKVDNKPGNLGEAVKVTKEKSKVVVESSIPMSKRYMKYLTKKYLKKQQLRDFLRVISNKKDSYELRYFNMANDEEETE